MLAAAVSGCTQRERWQRQHCGTNGYAHMVFVAIKTIVVGTLCIHIISKADPRMRSPGQRGAQHVQHYHSVGESEGMCKIDPT